MLRCVKDLVENKLPMYGPNHRWQHYHADGGKELLDARVKGYLREQFGCKFTWSSTDTPETNATSERRFRTLGERTHAMLKHSGLPVDLWFKAYKAACYITRRLPTKTAFGWMSPHEAVPGGTVPDLSRLRIWGCKAYVKQPRGSLRKDWEDKARIGYFVGYSEEKMGHTVWLPQYNTEETSVHVLFDESIPSRADDYYKELDEVYALKTSPEERAVEDYAGLVGAYHIDEGLLFKTTRVVVRKGLIVGYRALVVAGKTCQEEKTPLHVADLEEMSAIFAKRLEKTMDQAAEGGRSTSAEGHGGDRKRRRKEKRKAVVPGSGASNSSVVNEQIYGRSEDPPKKRAAAERVQATGRPPEEPASAERRSSTGDPIRRSTRMKRPTSLANVSKFGEEIHLMEFNELEINSIIEQEAADELMEPLTHAEALASDQADEWSKARAAEKRAIDARGTLEVVSTPAGVCPIGCRYVYRIKRDELGMIKKFKARLVVLGCQQKKEEKEQNYAPVVKGVTIRLVIAIAFIFGMYIHQLDVGSAFCYGDVKGDIYMRAPPDLDLGPGKCFKLKKSLYGLRQSPRQWNKMLDKFIKGLHFKSCITDLCLYYRWRDGKLHLILVYVDDIIIASADLQYIADIKSAFTARFDMTDCGELKHYLNVHITRTRAYIAMDQTAFCEKVFEKFGRWMGPANKTRRYPLPGDASDKLFQGRSEELSGDQVEYVRTFPYKQIVGAVLYLAMHTRPDIAYAVGVLARHASNPSYAACLLAVHLLQYLRGTHTLGIRFSAQSFDMHAFSDADWASDKLTRKSTTGYVVIAAGGPIAWQSKIQTTVATSSMESEYMAMYAAIQELVWLRGVLKEIGLPCMAPIPLFIDSQSAQDLAMNPVAHQRSKHIDIKYHWIREHVGEDGFGTADCFHVKSDQESADIFTKSLTGIPFETHDATVRGERPSISTEVKDRAPKSKRKKK